MYFGIIEDERDPYTTKHKLIDILKLVMISVLCGMDELDKMIDYGKSKKEFEIKSIPSKSTLTRIFVMLNPKWLGLSIVGIVQSLIKEKHTQIMIDGKAIKSTDAIKTIEKMMNIVTAYTNTGISLLQKTVDNKTNEIPAVKELIDMLDIKGMIITADAMHCQKETAEKIINNGGDYVLQLKANQKGFYEDVYAMFDDKYMDETDKNCEYETYKTEEKSHGRIEKRTCYVLNEIAYFTDYLANWKGLKKIFAVVREVEKDNKITKEISCYLSSKNTTAENLLSYTRNHWQVESFHWLLDMNYDEDDSRVINKNSQECLNIIRKYAISILKKYIENNEVKRKALSANMRKCMMNERYLESVLEYYCHTQMEEYGNL